MHTLKARPVDLLSPGRAVRFAAACLGPGACSVLLWPGLLRSEDFLVLGGVVVALLAINVGITILGMQYRRSVELNDLGVAYRSRGRRRFIPWREVVTLEPGLSGGSQIRIVGLNDSVFLWLSDFGTDPGELLDGIRKAAGLPAATLPASRFARRGPLAG